MAKHFVLMTLMATTIMCSCSCTKPSSETTQSVYRMPLADKVQTLSPRLVRSVQDEQIMKAIFDQPIGVDKNGYMTPHICSKWEISQDLKEYTLYLRKDVSFQDGISLTAKDIIFSFEYEGKNPTIQRKIFSPIEGYDEYYAGKAPLISGISILDDYTVKIKLNKPISTFLYTLANGKFVILPLNFHGIAEEEFFRKPIGAGPYLFDHWNSNELSIIANDKYFDTKARVHQFVFTTLEKKEAIDTFNRGKANDLVSYKVTPADVKRADVNIYKWNAFSTHFLFFNLKKAPLDNMYLRLAIRAAVDRKKLVNTCYPEDVLSTGVVPEGLIGAIDDVHAFDDLDKPVDYYLEKGGLNRKQLPNMVIIRLKELEDDCFKPTIEEMFRKEGLLIEVKFVTYEEAVKKVESNDYYILSEWLSTRNVEPINIINFFDGRSSHNLSNVNDSEINHLIDMVELVRTRSARGDIYRQLSEMIIRKAYAVDMQFENRYYVYDKNVCGVDELDPARYFLRLDSIFFCR